MSARRHAAGNALVLAEVTRTTSCSVCTFTSGAPAGSSGAAEYRARHNMPRPGADLYPWRRAAVGRTGDQSGERWSQLLSLGDPGAACGGGLRRGLVRDLHLKPPRPSQLRSTGQPAPPRAIVYFVTSIACRDSNNCKALVGFLSRLVIMQFSKCISTRSL